MMPFLNKNKIAQNIIERRHKSLEAKPEVQAPENESKDQKLEIACEDLLRAIEQKSVKDLMKASIAIHEAVDKYEHEEGPHTNEKE